MKIDENMDIIWDTLANSKSYRKWIVSKIKYNYDKSNYTVRDLEVPYEYAIFGEPFSAYKHATHILNKYKKIYPDCKIVIEEAIMYER